MAAAIAPGPTYCLLIGAARRPIGVDLESEERQFDATLKDLAKMVNWCAKFVQRRRDGHRVYPIHAAFLVNKLALIPSSTSPFLTAEGQHMMKLMKPEFKQTFSNKMEVRRAVKSSIEETSQKNVIIFFSGHGALTAPRSGYSVFSQQEFAVGGLTHHALVLPRSVDPQHQSYTDQELTNDVVHVLKGRPDRNVYLVLHACNSGGMFRGWQVATALRKEHGLSIALFASAAGDSTSQWESVDTHRGYVSIFTGCAQPGVILHTIQSNIFTQSLDEAPGRGQPGHSPCLVTIRPAMAAMEFLPE